MERLRALPLRLIALVLAIALAAVATFALRDWLRGVEEEALAEVELVEVLIARIPLDPGTSVEDALSMGAFGTSQIPRDSLPPTVVTDLSQVAGLVVATPLLAGDILQPARFASVAESAARFEIPQGMQAITFEVGVTEGVANFIQPEDRINILAHIRPGDETSDVVAVDPSLGPIASDEERTRVLLQNVSVLEVGRRITVVNERGAATQTTQRGDTEIILTVAVTLRDAERIAYAVRTAQLYLTLLPELEEGDTFSPETTPGRTRDNLYDN